MSCEEIKTNIYKGDDLQAFEGTPIRINIINEEELIISKAAVVVNEGAIVKYFENPEQTILVNFDSNDTKKLAFKNVMQLVVWDEQGRKRTCDGKLVFTANKEVLRGS